jgi:hypothetical protein
MGLSRKLGNLGTALDSGSLSNFLTTNNIEGLFRDVTWTDIANKPTTLDSAAAISYIDSAYIQARQTDIGLESAEITSLVDSAYISARQITTGIDSAGVIGIVDSAYLEARVSGGLDSAAVSTIIDSSYISSKTTVNSGFDFVSMIAEDGQTVFESDGAGNAVSYQYNGLLVWYNGVLIDNGVDYSALTGTSITLTDAADSGASVVVGKWAIGETYLWGGDRGVVAGGNYASGGSFIAVSDIRYFDMTTDNDASDFGDLPNYEARGFLAGTGNRTRGLFLGGEDAYTGSSSDQSNKIEYITIATTSDAQDFGDLTAARRQLGAAGNGTRALAFGGSSPTMSPYSDVIDYVTIDTPGNATDFGDTFYDKLATSGVSDLSRVVISSGFTTTLFVDGSSHMGYVNIATPGNASTFGDLSLSRSGTSGCSDQTRGVFAGGRSNSNYYDTMDYITIQTLGNATDFGDLRYGKQFSAGSANGTIGSFAGGDAGDTYPNYQIDKITIQTLGNSSFTQSLASNPYQSVFGAGAVAGDPS